MEHELGKLRASSQFVPLPQDEKGALVPVQEVSHDESEFFS